tara:strand:- start:240 stop:989 length:750 start_codon:yes stop_codon:yes gene_type:complete
MDKSIPTPKVIFKSSVTLAGVKHKDMTKEQISQHRKEYYQVNKFKINQLWRKKRAEYAAQVRWRRKQGGQEEQDIFKMKARMISALWRVNNPERAREIARRCYEKRRGYITTEEARQRKLLWKKIYKFSADRKAIHNHILKLRQMYRHNWIISRIGDMKPLEHCIYCKRIAQQRRASYERSRVKKGKPYMAQLPRGKRAFQTPSNKNKTGLIYNREYNYVKTHLRKERITKKKLKVPTYEKKTVIISWD